MVAFHEIACGDTAEIGEVDPNNLVMMPVKDLAQPQLRLGPLGALFQVPLSFLAPAEPDGPIGSNNLAAGLVIGHRLPVGVVGFAQLPVKILGPQHSARDKVSVAVFQPHQHRHVGVFAGVVLEVFGLPVQMELAQDDVAHGHRQSGISASLWI